MKGTVRRSSSASSSKDWSLARSWEQLESWERAGDASNATSRITSVWILICAGMEIAPEGAPQITTSYSA